MTNNNSNDGKTGTFVVIILIVLMLAGLGSCLSGSSDKKYKCKYCGREMEAYWSYHDGYVCYSCDKKYYK